MSDAEFILNKWAARQGWNDESKLTVILAFIDELGEEAIGLFDRHLATTVRRENEMSDPSWGGKESKRKKRGPRLDR